MKAILEFSLPEDSKEHLCAVHAQDLAFVLWEFLHNKKKPIEYMIEEKNLAPYEVLQEVRKMLYDMLQEEGINIDALV